MTATNTSNVTVSLADVTAAVYECVRQAITKGRNWHAVTVGVDGEPYIREEVSRCVSAAEYYLEGRPHPMTVYATQGDGSVAAEDIEACVEAADVNNLVHFEGLWGRSALRAMLEHAGFAVTE